ncbi:MAG TPA: metal ABC transporter permease, partial [Caldilineaceae bacterium]|nr:metal ABC transporter permease [Caldilineaceae bacterium]
VGVVLMSAMVVAPAASARQWTNRLGLMVVLASLFGAAAGVTGALISSLGSGLSTGPVIVLCAGVIVLISLLLAPNRGLLWNWLSRQRSRRRLQTEQVLTNLYRLAAQHQDMSHAHAARVLGVMGARPQSVAASLQALAEQGLVRQAGPERWALTPAGIEQARRLLGPSTPGPQAAARRPVPPDQSWQER